MILLFCPMTVLEFDKCNMRLKTDIKPKEATFQVVLDVLALIPFYQAFLIDAEVLGIYMQEFWATISVHKQKFEDLLWEHDILSFIRHLGQSGDIIYLSDVNIDYLHQPWRAFVTIGNGYSLKEKKSSQNEQNRAQNGKSVKETVSEIEHAFEDKQYQPKGILELFHKLYDDVQNIHEELTEYINTPSWNRPTIYCDDDDDDDKDYTIAITPDLPITDSLIMEDEHLDTIPATESDELIKSSIEDLVHTPNQFKGFSDSNDDSTSIDDDSFSIDDIDYVNASPPGSELVSLEVVENVSPEDGEIDTDILLIKDDVLRKKLLKINLVIAKIDALNVDPTPYFDFKNSGSTTIHADISLLDLECVYFKSEPDPGDLTSIDLGIRESVSSTTNVNLPFEDDQSPLFAYVVWIFLPFLTYLVAPPYLLSSGNEDTIFDPDISIYHSFISGVSHRSGTFMKFN
ncbi:hypothetical protein Tco_0091285 [Tanacetum coccineum]